MDAELSAALHDADLAQLGRRIKGARLSLELTQGQLGEGIASIGYISRIEAGQRRPDPRLLESLAARLGVTVDHLVLGVTRDELAEAQLALDHAELAHASGDHALALEACTRLLGEKSVSGSAELRRRTTLLRARSREAVGDVDSAILELEDLVDDSERDLLWLQSSIALSRCYRESGDLARAIASGEAVTTQLEALGLDATDEAVQVSVTLAAAYFESGDTAHAARICRRAIARAETLDSPLAKASAYWNASVIESRRGSVTAAVPLARRAVALLETGSDNRNLARLRTLLGILLLRLDPPELEEAASTLEQAGRELAWSSATSFDGARQRVALARLAHLRGDQAQARSTVLALLDDAAGLAPLLLAEAHALLGQVASASGDPDGAVASYLQAVRVLSGLGADRGAAQLWFELGGLLEGVGADDQARDAYKRAAAAAGLTLVAAHRARV